MNMKTRKGFTLIEIMIAVGIMLILSTVMTVSVVTYLQKANTAKRNVELHQDKFDQARVQVDGLLGAPGLIVAVPAVPDPGVPDPDPDPVVPDPDPDPDPVVPDPDPDPDPAPVLPPPYPGTSVNTPEDISGWGQPYNYRAGLNYGQLNKIQYLTLYIPEGAVLYTDWGAEIVSQGGTEAVLKVPANTTTASIFVKFPEGTPSMVITIVSRHAP